MCESVKGWGSRVFGFLDYKFRSDPIGLFVSSGRLGWMFKSASLKQYDLSLQILKHKFIKCTNHNSVEVAVILFVSGSTKGPRQTSKSINKCI